MKAFGLFLASAVIAPLTAGSCSNGPNRVNRLYQRVVVHRLLEPSAATGLDAPRSPRYRWSAEAIASDWNSEPGEDSVTLVSPRLELESLDAVDRITLTFVTPLEPRRAVLLWSAEPRMSRADFLRNRRELRPDANGVVVVRGKDLRAYAESPFSHLFLHLTGVTSPQAILQAIEVGTIEDATSSSVRAMVAGQMRDALYLTPNATWSSPNALEFPADAVLHFGLSAERATRVRLRLVTDGTARSLFEGPVEGRRFRDVEVPLPRAASASFEVEVEGEAPLLWGNPVILAPASTRRPNVILYVVDSLRADVLGLYGGERGVSPFLDGLAAKSLVFERGYAAASWTKPSVASLMTSLYPGTHRLGKRHYTDPLPDEIRTLADYFREAGYVTAQFTANPFSGTLSNLDRGFDEYSAPDAFSAGSEATHVRAEAINAHLLPWLEAHAGDRFFVYIQSVDPHPPFDLEEGEVAPIDAYRNAVRANDEALARLYRRLEALDLTESTLFVVTADHGEAFGEHERSGHGQSVYEEEVRIPLLLHWPDGIEPARVSATAHHVDILPTVLDFASIPVEASRVEGRSLKPTPGTDPERRPVFVSRFVYPDDVDIEGIDRSAADAVIEGPWKLIVSEASGVELYDLASDPTEARDLASEQPERVAALRDQLEAFLADRDAARERLLGRGEASHLDAPREPSPGVLEQLRALGYVR